MIRSAILLLLVAGVASCHKKEPEPVTRLIPAEMKAYWNFKVGTWWAYQDSVTGAIDTVKVMEYSNNQFDGTLSHSGDPARCESLRILTYNTGDQYYNDYLINTAYSTPEGLDYNVVFRTKYGGPNGGSEGANKCFVYPFEQSFITYDAYDFQHVDSCRYKASYDSMWGFYDVVQMNENYNTVDGDQHTRTFWAKNVGIIKQMFVDSAVTKTLVDYHIEP